MINAATVKAQMKMKLKTENQKKKKKHYWAPVAWNLAGAGCERAGVIFSQIDVTSAVGIIWSVLQLTVNVNCWAATWDKVGVIEPWTTHRRKLHDQVDPQHKHFSPILTVWHWPADSVLCSAAVCLSVCYSGFSGSSLLVSNAACSLID